MFTKNFHLLLVYLQIHSGLRPKKGWMGTICSHGCTPYFGSLFARICSVFLLGGVFGVLPSVRGCIAQWMNWTSIPHPLISHFKMQFEMVFSLYNNISRLEFGIQYVHYVENKIQFSKCENVNICDLKLLNIN